MFIICAWEQTGTSHPGEGAKAREKFPGTWRKFGASALSFLEALFSGIPRQTHTHTKKKVAKDELCAGTIAGF